MMWFRGIVRISPKGGGGGVSHPLYFSDCHVNIPPLLSNVAFSFQIADLSSM